MIVTRSLNRVTGTGLGLTEKNYQNFDSNLTHVKTEVQATAWSIITPKIDVLLFSQLMFGHFSSVTAAFQNSNQELIIKNTSAA